MWILCRLASAAAASLLATVLLLLPSASAHTTTADPQLGGGPLDSRIESESAQTSTSTTTTTPSGTNSTSPTITSTTRSTGPTTSGAPANNESDPRAAGDSGSWRVALAGAVVGGILTICGDTCRDWLSERKRRRRLLMSVASELQENGDLCTEWMAVTGPLRLLEPLRTHAWLAYLSSGSLGWLNDSQRALLLDAYGQIDTANREVAMAVHLLHMQLLQQIAERLDPQGQGSQTTEEQYTADDYRRDGERLVNAEDLMLLAEAIRLAKESVQ